MAGIQSSGQITTRARRHAKDKRAKVVRQQRSLAPVVGPVHPVSVRGGG